MEKKSDGYLQDLQLHQEILKYIHARKYRLTRHAADELKNDDLDLRDVIHVLKSGQHNNNKTGFDAHHQMWKYAIEGDTEDLNKKIRIIIAFAGEMLIITAMEL